MVHNTQELALRHLGIEVRELVAVQDRRDLAELGARIDVIELQSFDSTTNHATPTEQRSRFCEALGSPLTDVLCALHASRVSLDRTDQAQEANQ